MNTTYTIVKNTENYYGAKEIHLSTFAVYQLDNKGNLRFDNINTNSNLYLTLMPVVSDSVGGDVYTTIIKHTDSAKYFSNDWERMTDSVIPTKYNKKNIYTLSPPSEKGKYFILGLKEIKNPFLKHRTIFMAKFEIK